MRLQQRSVLRCGLQEWGQDIRWIHPGLIQKSIEQIMTCMRFMYKVSNLLIFVLFFDEGAFCMK